MTGLQIIGHNQYQFEYCGVKYIAVIRVTDNGHYYRWEIKQEGWIKGMPVWKSDLHLADDKDAALRQVRDRLSKTTARVQESSFA